MYIKLLDMLVAKHEYREGQILMIEVGKKHKYDVAAVFDDRRGSIDLVCPRLSRDAVMRKKGKYACFKRQDIMHVYKIADLDEEFIVPVVDELPDVDDGLHMYFEERDGIAGEVCLVDNGRLGMYVRIVDNEVGIDEYVNMLDLEYSAIKENIKHVYPIAKYNVTILNVRGSLTVAFRSEEGMEEFYGLKSKQENTARS